MTKTKRMLDVLAQGNHTMESLAEATGMEIEQVRRAIWNMRFLGYIDEGIAFCAPTVTGGTADLQATYTFPGATVRPDGAVNSTSTSSRAAEPARNRDLRPHLAPSPRPARLRGPHCCQSVRLLAGRRRVTTGGPPAHGLRGERTWHRPR